MHSPQATKSVPIALSISKRRTTHNVDLRNSASIESENNVFIVENEISRNIEKSDIKKLHTNFESPSTSREVDEALLKVKKGGDPGIFMNSGNPSASPIVKRGDSIVQMLASKFNPEADKSKDVQQTHVLSRAMLFQDTIGRSESGFGLSNLSLEKASHNHQEYENLFDNLQNFQSQDAFQNQVDEIKEKGENIDMMDVIHLIKISHQASQAKIDMNQQSQQ